jgi:hypothetical protein
MPTRQVNRRKNPKLYKRVSTARQAKIAGVSKANMRARKRKFAASRRPFVEVKSRSHKELWQYMKGSSTETEFDTIVNPTVIQHMTTGTAVATAIKMKMLPIWSFLNPIQGVTQKDIIGTTLVGKYLTAKVQFYYPQTPQVLSPRYYLVHGWVKVPCNNTAYTTPSRVDFTRENLLTHIENHVKNHFDEDGKDEFLQYKERTNKDFITLGYKRITTDRNANGGVNPQAIGDAYASAVVGSNSIKTYHLKWPMQNKQLKYIFGTENDVSGAHNAPFMYNNKSWLPFLLYYCPDAPTITAGNANSPTIAYNNKFWFTDS